MHLYKPGLSARRADATLTLLDGDPTGVPVVSVEGFEELGRLFEFEIVVAIPFDAAAAYREDTFVGQPATVSFFDSSGDARVIRGCIIEGAYCGQGHSCHYYRWHLAPLAWALTQRRNSRIFQKKSTPQIIRRVLADHGLAHRGLRFALLADYGKRDYCVQYDESDWDFVVRLMEEEGMYHYYHVEDGAPVLHITDGPHGHFEVAHGAEARFKLPTGAPEPGHVHEFHRRRQLRPARVVQSDYAARSPRMPLQSRARDVQAKGIESNFEHYHFPGEYRDGQLAQRLSRVRLEELRTGAVQVRGRSTRVDFGAGSRFHLIDHPLSAHDGAYVLTRVRHRCVTPMAEQLGFSDAAGAAGGDGIRPSYENEFEAIPAEQPFRLRRTTPRPRMGGPHTAVVVGPEGEEIYTDRYGRVKVRFHWDREEDLSRDGRKRSDSSCWIRVSQPWAGIGYGGLTIPRIGQEVIVDFLDGDPDQPIITGRVYNGDAMPPQDLPANKVRSTLRSNTHKGSGFNELTMDDTTGKEHFYMKSQYDKTEEIGNNRNTSVGVDSTEIIGNNDAQIVGNNKSTDVTNAYNVSCDTMLINAKTSITLQCGASRIHMNQAGFITITGNVITSAAAVNNSVIAPLTQIVGAGMLIETGGIIQILGGVAQMRAAGQASVYGAKTDVVAAGDNVIQGGIVKIN